MLGLALAQSERAEPLVVAGAAAVITWSMLLVVTAWTSAAAIVAPVVVALSIVINLVARVRPDRLGVLATGVVALAALGLLIRANIHGSALAAGLAFGILLACRHHSRP